MQQVRPQAQSEVQVLQFVWTAPLGDSHQYLVRDNVRYVQQVHIPIQWRLPVHYAQLDSILVVRVQLAYPHAVPVAWENFLQQHLLLVMTVLLENTPLRNRIDAFRAQPARIVPESAFQTLHCLVCHVRQENFRLMDLHRVSPACQARSVPTILVPVQTVREESSRPEREYQLVGHANQDTIQMMAQPNAQYAMQVSLQAQDSLNVISVLLGSLLLSRVQGPHRFALAVLKANSARRGPAHALIVALDTIPTVLMLAKLVTPGPTLPIQPQHPSKHVLCALRGITPPWHRHAALCAMLDRMLHIQNRALVPYAKVVSTWKTQDRLLPATAKCALKPITRQPVQARAPPADPGATPTRKARPRALIASSALKESSCRKVRRGAPAAKQASVHWLAPARALLSAIRVRTRHRA